MKRFLKKTVSVLMIVVMCLTMAPLQGFVGIDIGSWFASEASAAVLTEDEYIQQHVDFVDSSRYSNLIETGGFYNSIWQYEETTKKYTAYATWYLAGAVGDFISFNWGNLFNTKNPYDIIFADIFSNYALNDNVLNACENFLKGTIDVNDMYDNILKMLRTSSQWDKSMEIKIKEPIKNFLSSHGSSLIDGVLVSTEDYKFKQKEPEAYNILTSIFPSVSDNSWDYVFKGLDEISTIKDYVNSGMDIVGAFFDAYQKYLIAKTLVTVEQDIIGALGAAGYYMSDFSKALLNASLDEYTKVLDDDIVISVVLDYAAEDSIKNTYDLFKGSLSKLVYNAIANVFGISPGSVNEFVFYYNVTYSFLDYFSGLGEMSPLFFLIESAAALEKGLVNIVDDAAIDLKNTPTLNNTKLFDSSWGLLQSVESYLFRGLSKYISGMKQSYKFSFTVEDAIISAFPGYNMFYLIYSKQKLNNKLTLADNGIESALHLESVWRNASCHVGIFDNSKIVSVKCPTDVYVYDENKQLALSIVDNKIVSCDYSIAAIVDGDEKIFSLPVSSNYNIKIVGTNEGTMDYTVTEISENTIMRTVEYESIPLTTGCEYNASMPKEIYTDVSNYNLTSDNGEIIEATYDSHPPTEDNIVDVIVAEELFDGFPVEIIDLVADTMFNMKSVVDLSAYDISTDDSVALFSAVAKYYPAEYSLIANSDFTYKIIVSPNLDRIMKIRFYYGDDANLSTYQKRVNDLNAEIDALVAKVEGMDEFEKALYIHDYIVLNSEYDLELLEYMEKNNFILPGELRSEKYTEYSILVNGTGVCGSYALAYRAVLNAAGMECLYLSSPQMNHAWNLVKIDDKWYHVDCCWDDPVPDTYGRARRTYFLRTDKEIMDLNHYSWTPGQYKATSEKYSEMPRYYDNKQKYDEAIDSWYYLEGTTLYSADEYGKNETEITSISASSIDADDGSVYYSTGRYIYEYDIENDERNLVYMLSNKDSGENLSTAYLSNIYVEDENVEFYKSIYKDNKTITVFDNDTLQREKIDAVTGVEINYKEAVINVFDTLQVFAEIKSTISIEGLDVTWTSSDEMIATVDKNGLITAKNVGVTTITAMVFDHAVACEITVTGDGLSGGCGKNVKWFFDVVSGDLLILGAGEMDSFSSAPWYSLRQKIKKVIIESGVISIASSAFPYCHSLISVTMGNSVKSIGEYAFDGCDALKSIVFSNELTTIGNTAFRDCCSLESIALPDKVISIGSRAFQNCKKLKTIFIPNGTKTIKSMAFSGCDSLVSVMIPSSVEIMAGDAFEFCDTLTSISVDENNSYFSSDSYGVLFDKSKTKLIQYPIGSIIESYSIPYGVMTIESWSFCCARNIKNIIVPNSVTKIGTSAFEYCSQLENISIPKSVKEISSYAFNHCYNLANIMVDHENKYYSSDELGVLFNKDKTKLILYPSGNTRTKYIIPNSVISLEVNSFLNCSYLCDVFIPYSVTDMCDNIFDDCCSLEKITVDLNNQFYSSDENGVLFNKEKTILLQYPIGNTSFNYTVPESVGIISESAFEKCSNIISVTIPFSVQTIGHGAFGNCNKLTKITVSEDNKYYSNDESGVLFDKDKTTLIQYPVGNSMVHYAIPDSVNHIGMFAFENCDNIMSIAIPNGVWYIDNFAFENCKNLTHIGYAGTEDDFLNYVFIADGNMSLINDKCVHYSFNSNVDMITMAYKPATCTEYGNTEAVYCCICDCYVYGEEIPLKGHEYTITDSYSGDCVNISYQIYTCSVCGDAYTKEGKIEDGHSYVETVIAPTCTEKGYTTAICSVCNETVIYDFTSPKGHEFVINRSADYCSAHGTLEYSCKNCDYTESIVSAGVDLVTETVTVEPTCTKSGTKAEICTLCGATVSVDILNPLSHEYSEEYTVDVAATCTTVGRKSQHCIRCDAKRAVTTIESTGHQNTSIINVVNATCTKNGYTGDTFCSDCNSIIANGTNTDMLKHEYNSVVTAPTCTTNGFTTYTCTSCGDAYTSDETAMLGHSYVSVITPASCTAAGYTTYTCSVCSHSYTGDTVASIGHSYNDNGTCSECGKSRAENCSHMCHKSGFMGFIWKIVKFFCKLFKINPVCGCGIAHY